MSVVIPSYNGADRLPRVLMSLGAGTHTEWEAIVVLDGSTDNSEAVVRQWAEHLPVSWIRLPANEGRPAALNTGFAAATGEILVRCDDDLELPPGFLANHANRHLNGPVGVAGMCLDVFPETAYARAYGRQADLNIRGAAYAAPPEVTWHYWAANCSVTRETYDAVGPYDESFREYGWEDVDWGYRLCRAGVPVVIAPEVEARHHNPALSARDRSEKAFASGASRRMFESKHPDSGMVLPTMKSRWTPWNTAVRGTALCMKAGSVARVAGALDLVAGWAPTPVARKVISLSVESAGLAGQLRS